MINIHLVKSRGKLFKYKESKTIVKNEYNYYKLHMFRFGKNKFYFAPLLIFFELDQIHPGVRARSYSTEDRIEYVLFEYF